MAEEADLGRLKALAHPLRQRILERLSHQGPATSTTLANELGVTSGGTSYNLRVLAEHGLIEEVPERARGRERWWRSARADVRLPPMSEQPPALKAVIEQMQGRWLTADLESFERFMSTRHDLGEWGDALVFSRGSIRVDITELKAFFEEYIALVTRYSRPEDQTPSGARTVLARMMAFPAVEPKGE